MPINRPEYSNIGDFEEDPEAVIQRLESRVRELENRLGRVQFPNRKRSSKRSSKKSFLKSGSPASGSPFFYASENSVNPANLSPSYPFELYSLTAAGMQAGEDQRSLQILQDLFEQAPAAIGIFYGPEYKIEMANPLVCQFWGRTREQVIGKPLFEALPEASHQGYEEFLDSVLKTGEPFIGYELPVSLVRSGKLETVYFNFVYNPMRNASGEVNGVIMVATEVTEQLAARKQAEQAIAESLASRQAEEEEKRLHELFLQAPAGIAILKGPEHVFELANSTYLKLVGESHPLIGKPVREALPEVEDQGFFERLDEIYQSGKAFFENELKVQLDVDRTGQLSDRFVNVVCQPLFHKETGRVEGIFVHLVDVTELIQARKKAERLAAELEAVFESMPDAIYVGDMNGIRRANQHALEILGYASLEDLNRQLTTIGDEVKVRSIETGEQIPAEQYVMAQALEGKSVVDEYLVFNLREQRDIFVRGAGAPIRQGAEILGGVVIQTDITRQMKAQEALSSAIAELKQANQSKDELVALVSHDLRTPLTIISGNAQLLKQNLEKVAPDNLDKEKAAAGQLLIPKALRSTEAILHQAQRMEKLIGHLLEFSLIQAGKLVLNYNEPANLVDLVRLAVEDMSLINAGYTVVLQAPEAEILASFDASRLEQVLNNLIGNAIKYSPAGSTTTVGVERQADRPEVLVWVCDQGYGIDPEAQTHLFERFYRERTPSTSLVQGLGLGLYISQQIINEHGGTIGVKSQPGQGSTFYFTLPLPA